VLSVYLYERLKRSEFEVNRRLQTFLRSVSHDLKTPVLGISVVLQSLLREDKSESSEEMIVRRSMLKQLLNGSNRQLALIQSLLEAHTTEVQGVILHCEPIELKPLVETGLSDLHHEFSKKRVQLTNRITDGLPLVYADSNQLWRVFSNLIGNSLKHNPHDIQLTLEAGIVDPEQLPGVLERWQLPGSSSIQQLSTQGSMLLCVVQDNGKGISLDQVQRLFEPYTRGPQARYMPGLGLGLYLCKQIITAHGGDIGVVSNLSEGVAFWFTLPIA
ncbi:MAG: HAMP domain-containing sensor histidine kinase, partial [Cyanobacteria bacterium J06635_15]